MGMIRVVVAFQPVAGRRLFKVAFTFIRGSSTILADVEASFER